jgi:putative nucleotidyltransferase with HDIG domain
MSRPGEILKGLARARRTTSLYGGEHPVAAATLDELQKSIERMLADRSSITLVIHEDTFFVENTVLLEESLRFYGLLTELKERDIGIIEILSGVETWELKALAEVIDRKAADVKRHGGAAAILREQGVRHLEVGPIGSQVPTDQMTLRVDPRDVYRAALRAVDDLNYQASRELPLELRRARLVVSSLIDIMKEDRFALLGLAALQSYDEETCHHSVNVSILSLLMGSQLELDRSMMTTLGLAALMHDIGKMRVPLEILTKPGKLTAEELQQVRRHTFYGAHLLLNLQGALRLAMIVAFEHHVNYDRSGYPEIAVKEMPHLLTRIVQIADFYDAITSSRRAYHRATLPHHAVRSILDEAGRSFDPVLVKVFVQAVGLFPVGSVVRLDTRELAVVTKPGDRDVARPMVRVVRDEHGGPIAPHVLSLEETPERRITSVVDPVDLSLDGRALEDQDEPAEELAG